MRHPSPGSSSRLSPAAARPAAPRRPAGPREALGAGALLAVTLVVVLVAPGTAASPDGRPDPGEAAAGITDGTAFSTSGAGVLPDPAGAGDWTFADVDAAGRPFRWDPCRPLTYRIALNGAPWPEARRVRSAMASLGRALGVRTVFRGSTTFVPDTLRVPPGVGADVVVAFARPGSGERRSRLLGGDAAARAGFSLDGARAAARERGVTGRLAAPGPALRPVIRSGAVVVSLDGLAGYTPRMRRALYLHELGHVVGLGHAHGVGQVMHRGLLRAPPADWSPSDRAGLRRLGRAAGCLEPPQVDAPPTVRLVGTRVGLAAPWVRSRSGRVLHLPSLTPVPGSSGSPGSPSTPPVTGTRFTGARTTSLDWTRAVVPTRFVEDRVRRLEARLVVRNDVGETATPDAVVALPEPTYRPTRPRVLVDERSVRLPDVPAYYGDTDVVAGERSRATTGTVTLRLVYRDGSVGTAALGDGDVLYLGAPVLRVEARGAVTYGGAARPHVVDYTGTVRPAQSTGRSAPSGMRE